MANSYQEVIDRANEALDSIKSKVDALNVSLTRATTILSTTLKTKGSGDVEKSLKKQADGIDNIIAKKKKLSGVKDEELAEIKRIAAFIAKTQKQNEDAINRAIALDKKSKDENIKNIQNKIALEKKVRAAKIKEHQKTIDRLNKEAILRKKNEDKARQGRERQVKAESDLRERLVAQKAKQVKDDEKATNKEIANQKKARNEREKNVKAQSDFRQRMIAQRNKEEAVVAKLGIRNKHLARSYIQLVTAQKRAKDVLQDLISSGKASNRQIKIAQRHFDNLTRKVNAAKKAVSNFNKTGLGKLASGARNLVAAFGVIGGVTLFANLIKGSFELTKKIDSMGFSMRAVIKDSRELGQTQIWLRQIAEDYGAELITVTNRYIKFRAAAIQANFSAQETQKIFGTMTKAAGVLGLKTDELQGIFLALEQMISKGKITTEELRRQLGERLPGAMDIMAKSLGVTTAQLDEMLKKGQVITKDVLPAFAEQVEIAFGLNSVTRVETLQAATARLKNAWTILVEEFNKGSDASGTLMNIINSLAKNLGKIVKVVLLGGVVFLTYKTVLLAIWAVTKLYNFEIKKQIIAQIWLQKETIKTAFATKTLGKAMLTLGRTMLTNPIFLTIAALGLLFLAFKDSAKGARELTDEFIESQKEALKERDSLNEVTNSAEELFERYNKLTKKQGELKDGTKLNTTEQIELEKIIAKIGGIMPDVVTKVNEYTTATELNTQAVLNNLAARNIETGNQAAQDAIDNQIELKKVRLAYKEYLDDLKTGAVVEVEINGRTIDLIQLKGGALRKVSGQYRDANEFEVKAFNQIDAGFQRQISNLTNLRNANQDIAFETQGFFADETKERRAKAADEEKEAKRIKDEFNSSIVVDNLKKNITEAEKLRNDALGISKIDNEVEYAKAVADAIAKVTEEEKKRVIELTANIDTAKKALKDFTGVDPKKKSAAAAEKKRLAKKLKADKLLIKSAEELSQSIIKLSADTHQAIIDNENTSMGRRIMAARDLADDLADASKSKMQSEIDLAQLTAGVILNNKNSTDQQILDAEKSLNDKIEALKITHKGTLAEIELARLKNVKKAIRTEFKIRKEGFDQAKREREAEDNKLVIEENTKLDKKLDALKKEFLAGDISRKTFNKNREELIREHEEAKTKILREAAIERIKIAITNAKALAALIDTSTPEGREQKSQADAGIAEAEMSLSDMVTGNNIENMQSEQDAFDRLQEKRMEIISAASTAIAKALNLDASNLETFFLDIADGLEGSLEGVLETIMNVTAVVGDIMAAVHQRNIEQIDEEIQANSDFYANILNEATLSEEQRSFLEAERDAKEAVLEKKKRKEKTKAAKADKAAALIQATISTGLAILSALATVPFLPLGLAMAKLAGVLGVIQIAAIAATPIPKFERGKGAYDNYEGTAIWGEKRREAKISADGSIQISPTRIGAHLTHVKKDDIIHPNADKLMKELFTTNVDMTPYEFSQPSSMSAYLMMGDLLSNRNDSQTNRIVDALNKKKMSFKLNQTISLADDIAFLISKKDTL